MDEREWTRAKLDKKAVGDMGSRHRGCTDVFGFPYVILKDAPIPVWLCLAIHVVLIAGVVQFPLTDLH